MLFVIVAPPVVPAAIHAVVAQFAHDLILHLVPAAIAIIRDRKARVAILIATDRRALVAVFLDEA
jgi:FMN phosphatase YigB (HAD superfamily)